jgi:hypothetical protein
MWDSHVLIYVIGLDTLLTKAIRADLPNATIRWLRPLRPHGRRRGKRPDLLLIDISVTDPYHEVRAAWSFWDKSVVAVGVDRHQPFARVWRHEHLARIVEIGPGFLTPYLEASSAPSPPPQ